METISSFVLLGINVVLLVRFIFIYDPNLGYVFTFSSSLANSSLMCRSIVDACLFYTALNVTGGKLTVMRENC